MDFDTKMEHTDKNEDLDENSDNNVEDMKDIIEDEEQDNYYDIITFKNRINSKQTNYVKVKNEIFRIFYIMVGYFFGSGVSGYLLFLNSTVGTDLNIEIFQILTGYLVLVILANFWGPISGGIGAFLGDIIYQYTSLSVINWSYVISAVLIGVLSGLPKYDKNKTLPKLKIMKYFYLLVIGSILIPLIIFLGAYISNPNYNWNSNSGKIYTGNLVWFLISEIISFMFLAPIIIVIIDRALKKFTNEYDVLYIPILTHHYELSSDHAVPVNFGGYYIFFCTRCTAMVSGIITGVLIERIIYYLTGNPINPYFSFILCIFLPLPALIDWGTQKLLIRTSNDTIRLITGFLLGLSIQFTTLTQGLDLQIIILIILYFAIFGLFLYFGTRRLLKYNPEQY